MGPGALAMALVTVVVLAVLALLIVAMVRSIKNEWSSGQGIWRQFGLGLVLMLLFFATWISHGITEWQVFTDEQRAHGETPEMGDFMAEFGQSTLENWQSEFLQLFSFVVLAALFVHRGSAESKDSDERMEAALRRIEQRLGTLPPDEGGEGADGASDTGADAGGGVPAAGGGTGTATGTGARPTGAS